MIRQIVTALVIATMALPVGAAAQDTLREQAERLASTAQLEPPVQGGGGSTAKVITTVGLVAAGVGLAAIAKPEYVPSEYVPGNYPNRVDISMYLGAGTYPGHSYRLNRTRGDGYGRLLACTGGYQGFCATNEMLRENYDRGYIDGVDDGIFAGLIVGHEQGYAQGQRSVIEIIDDKGFVVYDGDFLPASYVKEQFSDKAGLRMAGVGLAAAGAIIALAWPDSPARNLELTPMRGGGRVGASFSF